MALAGLSTDRTSETSLLLASLRDEKSDVPPDSFVQPPRVTSEAWPDCDHYFLAFRLVAAFLGALAAFLEAFGDEG